MAKPGNPRSSLDSKGSSAHGKQSADGNQSGLWYKDAVIYQTHVRSFFDSDSNGIGDFSGLKEKLSYLQNLGVTALWLLPFYPSPLKDDGYDIADYTGIHPDYGTLDSFREFLETAHRLNLKVITELVINHTSDQHPWFQRARRAAPGTTERDFYVWSDTPDRYSEARIIFKDFEISNWTYDNLAKAYFWHRFYSHQPDLNFDNPAVREALIPIMDFWLGMGVDGLRLDAVPYLFEREGTNCENLPETHEMLRILRRHVDRNYPERMLLAEANQWPEDAAAYFGNGDECHMAFHFPVMPRLYMAVHREDRFPMVDILEQTPPVPENCQWAMFLRNHDELTLEMVTDEERDYMYRAYATDSRARINLGIRHRLAPLMGNNRRRIELMNGLLFSLPGTPVIYYGDEIGMGDNIFLGDRNGMRTPMQWSADRNAGFSRTNPQRLYLPINIDPEYHYESCNVEAQENNSHSLLWWMKRLIGLRKRFRAFSRGSLRFLNPLNRRVLSFLRENGDERVLVVANLSRFVQYVELDLEEFKDQIPIELFGGTRFPPIGSSPYFLTLGPHSFLWFEIQKTLQVHSCPPAPERLEQVPELIVAENLFESPPWKEERFTGILREFLNCRLATGSSINREVSAVVVNSFENFPLNSKQAWLLNLNVHLVDGSDEKLVFPIMFAGGLREAEILDQFPTSLIARVSGPDEGVLYDALVDREFVVTLLNLGLTGNQIRLGRNSLLAGKLRTSNSPREIFGPTEKTVPIRLDRMNATIDCGHTLLLKFLRKTEEGIPADVEFGEYFADQDRSLPVPRLIGRIDFVRPRSSETAIAVVSEYVPHEADAWHFTLDSLADMFAVVVANHTGPSPLANFSGENPPLLQAAPEDSTEKSLVAAYLDFVRLLGRRTADLHSVLGDSIQNQAFSPERFTAGYSRSLYQSMRGATLDVFDELATCLPTLDKTLNSLAREVLGLKEQLLLLFFHLLRRISDSFRIRCHGDYHLGHVLFTGKEVFVVNFESNPEIPSSERRIKRSPLRDIAAMLHSFEYASRVASEGLVIRPGRASGDIRPEDEELIQTWSRAWFERVSREFISVYLERQEVRSLLPTDSRERMNLLFAFLLERSLLSLRQDLRDRRHWLKISLTSLSDLVTRIQSETPVANQN